MSKYFVSEYNADGHGEPMRHAIVDSLAEARSLVREWLGRQRLNARLRWYPGDCDDETLSLVEAYHCYGSSHPRGYGCGGVSIWRKIEVAHRYTERCQMIEEHGRLTSQEES